MTAILRAGRIAFGPADPLHDMKYGSGRETEAPAIAPRQSNVMRRSRMTRPQLSVSALIQAANASGVLPTMS